MTTQRTDRTKLVAAFVKPPEVTDDPHPEELADERPQRQPKYSRGNRLAVLAVDREELNVERCGRRPHPPRRRGFDVLAPTHVIPLSAHRDVGVVDQLAHALVLPDRPAEQPEITVALADDLTAKHRYRPRRVPLPLVIGIPDDRRQILDCDGGLQLHGYGGIILVTLTGIRAAHGDHPRHHLAEAQTRAGHPQPLENLCGRRFSGRFRALGGIRFDHRDLLNSSTMNGNTSRFECSPRNTSRCP